jgi:hypothetical protein
MFDITTFAKPLDSKLRGKYIERFAFNLLKHILPEFSSIFVWADAPDLQANDKSVGVEITEAIAPATAQIDGEHAKWRFGKQTEHDKQECKRLIEKNGGTVDTIGISYPVVNSDMEWEIFEKALRKKLRILPTYKAKGFAKMGLFIFFNEPPIPFDLEASMTRFAEIQKDSVDQYDFLFFGYRTGVIGYNFQDMSYQHYPVDQDAFDDMSMHARKLVEEQNDQNNCVSYTF